MNDRTTSRITGRKVVRLLKTERVEPSVGAGIPFIDSEVFIQLDSLESFCFSKTCATAAALDFDEISSIVLEPSIPPTEAQEIQDPLIVDRILGSRILGFAKSEDLLMKIGILFDSSAILTMEIGETGCFYGVWSVHEVRNLVPTGSFFADIAPAHESNTTDQAQHFTTDPESPTGSPPSDGR